MTEMIDTETWVEEFLSRLFQLSGLDLSIEEMAIDEENTLRVHLAGPDSARAIGRDGQTLEAIQHVVVAAAIHAKVANHRVLVDIETYRERREQRVRDEALAVAREVRSTGEHHDFAPMPARERRLVHLAVAGVDGVKTESLGEGDDRYVRVVPA